MSHARPDPGDAIRRALHAAAGELEPRADGLERIQRRLRRPRPLPVAWIEAAWVRLSLRLPDSALGILDWLAAQLHMVSQHFMPPSASRDGAHRRRSRLDWARPVAAMGIAVSIVAAVVYMAIEVPQALVSTANPNSVSSSHGGNGGSTLSGTGKHTPGSGSGPSSSSHTQGGASASPSCSTDHHPKGHRHHRTHNKKPKSSPSPSPSTSPSPSDSPSPSASSSPSPSTSTSSGSTSAAPPANPSNSAAASSPPSPDPSSPSAHSPAASQTPGNPQLDRGAGSPCPSPTRTKKPSGHKEAPDVTSPGNSSPAQEAAAVWVLTAADARTWFA